MRRPVAETVSAPTTSTTTPHPGELVLTSDEREYLQSLPVLKVAFHSGSSPCGYLKANKRLNDMVAGYLSYLNRTLGVRFQNEATASFSHALETVREGKADLIAVAVGENAMQTGLLATQPYATFPLVIAGRLSAAGIEGAGDLRGKRVTINEGSGIAGLLQEAVPGLRLSTVSSVHAGMKAVADGKADAYVADLVTVEVELERHFAGALRIIGSSRRGVEMGFAVSPALGSRLVPLINRAIDHMPEDERLAIANRYFAAGYPLEPSWQQILKRIAPYLVAVVVFVGVLLRWQYQLRREASARRLAQQRLQAQLAFQRTLMDALPIPIAVKDGKGYYVEVNAVYQAIAGMTREQMIGALPSDLQRLESARVSEALEAGSQRALETRQLQQFAVDFQDCDGMRRHFLCWTKPIIGAGEDIAGIISAAVDVTDIRNAESKARAAEAMLVDVTRHLPATVFQMRERDGVCAYTWVSGNTQQLLDRSADSLVGDSDLMLDIVNPEDLRKALAAAANAKAKVQLMTQDLRFLVRGQTRWIRVQAMPQLEADGSVLWHGYYADRTEDREQSEVLAKAKNAAEAASIAKDRFLAMMSHEIRTPMNGILGLLDLLQNMSLTLEQQRMLALAGESGHALAQILDDILDYAKLEADRMIILRTPVDLRNLFDGVLSLLLPQAAQKNLSLRQIVGAELPAIVQADSIRLRQILFNLLGNAVKFTERGRVTLRVTVEPASGGPPNVVVEVEDSGIGIAKEDLSRLYEPFVQSKESATRRIGGTGLGLSIVRRLVDLMDGEVTLESEKGVGTTVVLRIPCEVVSKDFDIPHLKGRPLSVLVRDAEMREALIALGAAAGMLHIDAGDVLPRDGVLLTDYCGPEKPDNRMTIYLTDEFLPLGYRQDERGVLLGTNPLRWTAFLGALEAVLGHVPSASQYSTPAVGGPRVLLVEDHPINREVIQRQLSLLGYRCTTCANGQEALTAVHADTYDLVLTDCHMPVMDGFELTRSIRASERLPVRGIPVVGVTATIDQEEHFHCINVGMNGFLLKPATPASLHHAIEAALQGKPLGLAPAAGAQDPVVISGHEAPGSDGFRPERINAAELSSHLGDILARQEARQIFQQALKEDREALRKHLAELSPTGLHLWCHRAASALTMLNQPYLVQLVRRLDVLYEAAPRSEVQQVGASLLDMYDFLLDLLNSARDPCQPGLPSSGRQ